MSGNAFSAENAQLQSMVGGE
jgi:chromosome segregation ATPase